MSSTQSIILSVAAVVAAVAWEPLVAAFRGGVSALLRGFVPRLPTAPDAVAPLAPTKNAKVSFSESIESLSVVRNRLVETGCIDDKTVAAIEAVTHSLVAGTDK